MSKRFGVKFQQELQQRAEINQTRVIHALDITNNLKPDVSEDLRQQFIEQVCHLAKAVAPYVVAIKLNYPLVLATGLGIANQLKIVEPNLALIADFKIADIDNTNAWIARHTFSAGFDAVIVHGFIGTDAIQAVLNEARNYGDRGVILVVDMSHPGAIEFIHPQTKRLCHLATELKVTGVIAPGTRPEHVTEIRSWLGSETLILAPGVGAQGGAPGSAIAAGANYEIIGRSIYKAKDPVKTAQNFAHATYEAKPQLKPPSQFEDDVLVTEVALLLHDVGALQFGSFKLVSGKISPYYIDLRLVPSYPQAFDKLIHLMVYYLEHHPDIQFQRIAGVPTAGLSLATLLSNRLIKPLLYVRSKVKQYGRQQRIEGQFNKGEHVLVVDDLITDGGSKIEVVQVLRKKGVRVSDVFVVVDREQGGAAQLKQEQLNLRSLTSITNLVKALKREQRLSEKDAQKILTYIKDQAPLPT